MRSPKWRTDPSLDDHSRPSFTLTTFLVSDAGLNGDISNDEHSISSDVAADLAQDGDSMDSEREALNLVSVATLFNFGSLIYCHSD